MSHSKYHRDTQSVPLSCFIKLNYIFMDSDCFVNCCFKAKNKLTFQTKCLEKVVDYGQSSKNGI